MIRRGTFNDTLNIRTIPSGSVLEEIATRDADDPSVKKKNIAILRARKNSTVILILFDSTFIVMQRIEDRSENVHERLLTRVNICCSRLY